LNADLPSALRRFVAWFKIFTREIKCYYLKEYCFCKSHLRFYASYNRHWSWNFVCEMWFIITVYKDRWSWFRIRGQMIDTPSWPVLALKPFGYLGELTKNTEILSHSDDSIRKYGRSNSCLVFNFSQTENREFLDVNLLDFHTNRAF